jgi:hypothetical protein
MTPGEIIFHPWMGWIMMEWISSYLLTFNVFRFIKYLSSVGDCFVHNWIRVDFINDWMDLFDILILFFWSYTIFIAYFDATVTAYNQAIGINTTSLIAVNLLYFLDPVNTSYGLTLTTKYK